MKKILKILNEIKFFYSLPIKRLKKGVFEFGRRQQIVENLHTLDLTHIGLITLSMSDSRRF